MMEHRHLAIGIAYDVGPPPHTVEIVGEIVARVRTISPTATTFPTEGPLSQERTLYRCEGPHTFVVHTMEEYGDEPPRTLWRLEHFASWREVMEEHPDLAMRVATDQRYGGTRTPAAPTPGRTGLPLAP